MRKSPLVVIAASIVVCLSTAVQPAAGAAVSAADPIVIETNAPSSYHQWEFGADDPDPMPAGVRSIVADLGLPVQGSIDCWVQSPSDFFTATKTEAEWLASPTIDLPEDFLVVPGDNVYITCRTGEEEYWAGFYIRWYLVAVAGTGDAIDLPVDPEQAWSRHDTDYVGTRAPTVVPGAVGDVVNVVGPPGTFLPEAPLTGSFGNLEQDGWFDGVYFSEDATVSPDGSTLAFTIPPDPKGHIDGGTMYARFISGRTSDELPEGPSESRRTLWYGGFQIEGSDGTDPIASATRVELSRTLAVSVQRVRATAVVDTVDGNVTDGRVTFLVDGREVRTAGITAASDGRASVLLPKLPRGWHSVTARFDGNDDDVLPSMSAPVRLRILI